MSLQILVAAGIVLLAAAFALSYISSRKKLRRMLIQAQEGLPCAQYEAALLYYAGKRVAADKTLALHYLQSAADSGYAKALNALGALYHAGKDVTQDDQKALSCYRRSAEQEDLKA